MDGKDGGPDGLTGWRPASTVAIAGASSVAKTGDAAGSGVAITGLVCGNASAVGDGRADPGGGLG